MIARMNKVFLVLRDKERGSGLEALRKLGVVHVQKAQPSGSSWERISRDFNDVSTAINLIPKAKEAPAAESLEPAEALELARRIVALEGRKTEVFAELGSLGRELERCAPWGDFDPALVRPLEEGGLWLRFYSCDSSAESLIPPETEYLVLSRAAKTIRLATVGRESPAPELGPEFRTFSLPEGSVAAMRARSAELEAELRSIEAEQRGAASQVPALKRAALWIAEGMRYETVSRSFEESPGLCALKGFAPAASVPSLLEAARREGWAILVDDPGADDLVPTKVDNGPFVSLIRPVFDFLGIVPAYTEYEISPWFLGFFSLFTAMIFGDGGYGALILVAWGVLAIKARRSGKGQDEFLKLLLLIGLLTMGWGAATGTWFSLPVDSLPTFMRGLWPISNANPQGSQNIQVLCFLLGLLQLSIARIKNIIRDAPDLKFLAQLGSLCLVVGMFFGVLFLVVDPERFPLPPYAVWLILGGFTLSLAFGAYEGNVLKSLLEGLKNIIPNFLGAVGVFADIVSYIRLWALGLAGSALAGIINSMGGGMVKPALIAVAGIVILLFGHGLNLILSVLSVIVHAVRLNILEFSCNHLGMQWSGIAYDPFKVTFVESAEKRKESGV